MIEWLESTRASLTRLHQPALRRWIEAVRGLLEESHSFQEAPDEDQERVEALVAEIEQRLARHRTVTEEKAHSVFQEILDARE